MAGKKTSVFGIYSTVSQAEGAVAALVQSGFSNSDVSVLMPDNLSTRDLAHEKNTKAPEGAATGAASGALLGGALGWLARRRMAASRTPSTTTPRRTSSSTCSSSPSRRPRATTTQASAHEGERHPSFA